MWRHLPPGDDTFSIQLAGGASFRYTVEPHDPFVRQLYWLGMRGDEAASLAVFAAVSSAGGLVVDVGSHTGLYAMAALASNPDVEVLAFEPVAANVELLLANLDLNGWRSRCTVRQAAVSDVSGTTQFHVPFDDHPMSGSLDPGGFRGSAGTLIDIEVTSLDDALADRPVRIIKIDVEGFEDKVLAGATSVLREQAPMVMIECNPDGPWPTVEAVLKAHGYRFVLLDGGPPAPVDHIRVDADERFRNTLCLPPGASAPEPPGR